MISPVKKVAWSSDWKEAFRRTELAAARSLVQAGDAFELRAKIASAFAGTSEDVVAIMLPTKPLVGGAGTDWVHGANFCRSPQSFQARKSAIADYTRIGLQ